MKPRSPTAAKPGAARVTRSATFNARCMTRAILGQLQEALADCEQALRMKPNDAWTLDSRAFCRLKLGELDAAIADYDAALTANSKLETSLYGRGVAKRRKGDTDGAARDIAAARAIKADVADDFG